MAPIVATNYSLDSDSMLEKEISYKNRGVANLGRYTAAIAMGEAITFRELSDNATYSTSKLDRLNSLHTFNNSNESIKKRVAITVGLLQMTSCQAFPTDRMDVNDILKQAMDICAGVVVKAADVNKLIDPSFWERIQCDDRLKRLIASENDEWFGRWATKNVGNEYQQRPLATLHAALQEWNYVPFQNQIGFLITGLAQQFPSQTLQYALWMTLNSAVLKEQKKYAQVFLSVLLEIMELRSHVYLGALTPLDYVDDCASSLINAVNALSVS